ncbi:MULTISPECIES: hypothetical protein [unclassified Paraburkholderia]|uniref:hypothetical protein n=1 Tax=unclassified Paraburkholderia TaxID=2615204 RepID=UPI002AB29AE0|nr:MULTISPECIES: hypothetical protein [unclassified Paraburkholderia]
MANANLKPRRKLPVQRQTMMAVQIGQTPHNGEPPTLDANQRAAFPWMQLADEFLISPDYNYTIAGRPMTDEQIARRETAGLAGR